MSMQAALDEIAINDIAWNLRLYQYDTHDLTEALMDAGRKPALMRMKPLLQRYSCS
jgi:hypothetical protein